jgi:hypothetical protein
MTQSDKERYLNLTVIHTGHYDDLVKETGNMRVWVSRCEFDDEKKPVITIEKLIYGRWLVYDKG